MLAVFEVTGTYPAADSQVVLLVGAVQVVVVQELLMVDQLIVQAAVVYTVLKVAVVHKPLLVDQLSAYIAVVHTSLIDQLVAHKIRVVDNTYSALEIGLRNH